MEGLLQQEAVLEQHVHQLLKDRDTPLGAILDGFESYRRICQQVVFADFANAHAHEERLWRAHGAARAYFHRALSDFRKKTPDRVVETRTLIKYFLSWIKQGEKFYRAYILQLSTAAGGIPELEAVAQVENGVVGSGESQHAAIPSALRDAVLESCHRTLVFLGDLSRYRASEKLDKEPDFGPAIGYYGLAASLKPRSGLAHHQLAVVALAQSRHLTAIYHLYRSLSVQEPHPNASNNLRLEFDKTNAAWDKGDLIQKGMPNDPDASKHALVGWFVRHHGMCFRGDEFRAHEELEREVLSQLAIVAKQRALDGTLMRMVIVNIAAQYIAGEGFQGKSANTRTSPNILTIKFAALQTPEYQQSFLYFFRFNLKTFTILLRLFYDDLRALLLNMDDHDVELEKKLTQHGRCLLPCLRVYNNWLLHTIRMIVGLAQDDFVGDAISQFWPMYAKTLDLLAQAFPIWDLDEISEVSYMLEEDVDTLDFKPLTSDESMKTWYQKSNGMLRPRFSALDVVRVPADEEMLFRVRAFLETGVDLASSDHPAPLKIRGTRIFIDDESRIEPLTIPQKNYTPAQIAPLSKPKPVSYARAAANGHARSARPAQPAKKPGASKPQTRDAQLSRMVDDLLEDDGVDDSHDGSKPKTPPEPIAVNPCIVTNGELPRGLKDSVHELQPMLPKPSKHLPRPSAPAFVPQPNIAVTPPAKRRNPAPIGSEREQRDRLQSVSKFWDATSPISLSFPTGLPTGTLSSPVALHARASGHSRVNSASSIRSRNSLNVIDSWGSTADFAPRTMPDHVIADTSYGTNSYSSLDQSGIASPLLFGGAGGLWGTGRGFSNASAPYGPGG